MSRFTHRPLLLLLFLLGSIFTGKSLFAQDITVHGTVFNMYRTRPLDGVSVMCTCGKGTTTDSNGNYYIIVKPEDSISFSYLGRATAKFPVSALDAAAGFDIALHVDPLTLKEVKVMPQNYRMDSLKNREDYAKYFDFKKPSLKLTPGGVNGLGAGVDLDAMINVFRTERTHRMLAFQGRLVDEERDKFVDHRFSKYLVKKLTHIPNEELDTFMVRYRPSYEFCKKATDYDFYDYIKLAYVQYQKDRKDNP